MQLIRSVIFQIWMYGLMMVMGILGLPLAIWSRAGTYWVIDKYLDLIFWSLRVLCGLTYEVRGTPPTGHAMVASKHQCFLDVLILVKSLPQPKFIFKRSLIYAPILGIYALRTGATTVSRGKGAESFQDMMARIAANRSEPGQFVIYPQGTRVLPGVKARYKEGAYAIYRTYDAPCTPAAVNTGLFWPRTGLIRRPGVAVVEFLDPIAPGKDREAFMEEIEQRIEAASDALSDEAKRNYEV